MHRGCRAYMDACADPTVARVLADAPAVLGLAACRALDAQACLPLLEDAFARAAEEGVAVPGDAGVAAALLLGLLNEAAGIIAAAPFNRARRDAVTATVDGFLTPKVSSVGAGSPAMVITKSDMVLLECSRGETAPTPGLETPSSHQGRRGSTCAWRGPAGASAG